MRRGLYERFVGGGGVGLALHYLIRTGGGGVPVRGYRVDCRGRFDYTLSVSRSPNYKISSHRFEGCRRQQLCLYLLPCFDSIIRQCAHAWRSFMLYPTS